MALPYPSAAQALCAGDRKMLNFAVMTCGCFDLCNGSKRKGIQTAL